MDYKKKYKEEVVRATQLWECGDITRENLEYIFPELKESEDDRKSNGGIVFEDFNEGDGFYKVNLAYLSKEQVEEIENIVKKWNPEPEESEDEKIRKAIHIYLDWLEGRKDYAPKGKYTIKDMISWLEKQGEKKPADKVEPKFHEGDWIVYECGEETATLQITRIVGKTYVFSDNSTLGVVDEDALRLWDITKDAKDWNVLHSPSHRLVWIYKDNEHYHVCINMNYVTENIAIDGLIKIPSDVCPATSVQRAILFSKMEGAGYEWRNSELKELKKIKQKTAELSQSEVTKTSDQVWSEEDEQHIDSLLKRLDGLCRNEFERTRFAISEDEDWLKSLRQRIGG